MDTAAFVDAFCEMPHDNRLELLHQLWDRMLDDGWKPTLSDEQKAELDRRWANFQANPTSGLNWEQIVAGLRRFHQNAV